MAWVRCGTVPHRRSAGRYARVPGAASLLSVFVMPGMRLCFDALVERVRIDLQAQHRLHIEIIKAMWTQEKATFQGTHYQVMNATCEPRPDPTPPLIIGAFKPRMLRLTAKYADGWEVSSTGIVAYRRMAETFAQACAG
jgi:hypothetical protein